MGKYLSPPETSYQTKCAVIMYPHDDGAFFLNALRGQLSYLKKWYAWEGDRGHTNEIAQIWAIHDAMTDEIFFRADCEDIPLIVGDEDMNVNVNVQCSGNGGCCCDTNNYLFPDTENPEIEDFPEFPPEEDVGGEDSLMTPQEKCSLGTFLYESFEDLYLDVEDYWEAVALTIDNLYLWLTEKWGIGGASVLNWSTFLLGQILAVLTIRGLDQILDDTIAALQQWKNELICAISEAQNAQEARDNWYSVLASIRITHGKSVHALLWLQSHLWSWNGLMAGEVNVPSLYDSAVCNCGNQLVVTHDFSTDDYQLYGVNGNTVHEAAEGRYKLESGGSTQASISIAGENLVPGAGYTIDSVVVEYSQSDEFGKTLGGISNFEPSSLGSETVTLNEDQLSAIEPAQSTVPIVFSGVNAIQSDTDVCFTLFSPAKSSGTGHKIYVYRITYYLREI